MKYKTLRGPLSLLLLMMTPSFSWALPGENYNHIAYWIRQHTFLPRGENPIGYRNCTLLVRPYNAYQEISVHICYENQRSDYEMIRITRQQPDSSAAWCAGDWDLDNNSSNRMILKCLSNLNLDLTTPKNPKLQELLTQVYGRLSPVLYDFNHATVLGQGTRHFYQQFSQGKTSYAKLPVPPINEKILRGKTYDYWVNAFSILVTKHQNWDFVRQDWERDKQLLKSNP